MEIIVLEVASEEAKKLKEEAMKKRLSLQDYCKDKLGLSINKKREYKDINIIYPKNQYKNIVCRLGATTEGKIFCQSLKDEKIIEIVKSLRMKWDPEKGKWYRKISSLCGDINDRLAELGNKLLLAGFAVDLPITEAKEKAINGTYLPEYDRWVLTYKNNLILRWFYQGKEEGEKLYQEAKRLKSSRWLSEKGMLVNIEYCEEVIDFAEINGFKISEEAQSLINNHILHQQEVTEVKSPLPEEKKEIKEDLLEDLIDDD